jgi:hypothetical protein
MSIIRILGIAIFITVLANCGSQSVETPSATPWPSATIPAITQSTPTDTVVAAIATPIAATDTPAVVVNTDDTLASGLTPEGYHVLGDMAAPITFIDYSDFF